DLCVTVPATLPYLYLACSLPVTQATASGRARSSTDDAVELCEHILRELEFCRAEIVLHLPALCRPGDHAADALLPKHPGERKLRPRHAQLTGDDRHLPHPCDVLLAEETLLRPGLG